MAQAKDHVPCRGEVARIGRTGPASWLVLDSFRTLIEALDDDGLARIASNEWFARELGDEDSAWRCRDIVVTALSNLGRFDDSVALADVLAEQYLVLGRPAARLQVIGQRITSRFARGEFERALDELADALVGLSRLNDASLAAASAYLAVADAASRADMFEMAASQLRRATQLARDADVPFLSAMVRSTIARNDLRLAARLEMIGRVDEATARYREVLRAAVHAQATQLSTDWRRIGRLYEGYAWASLGEPEIGRIALLEALGNGSLGLDPEDTMVLHLGLARACAALGRTEEGRHHIAVAAELPDTSFSQQWRVAVMLQAAELERVEHGDHPAIDLARHAGVLLARSLWQERERRLEAVLVRMQMLDLAAENERVGQAATEDPLTGLGNRRRLDAALQQMATDATTTGCLLFVDLDRFKSVNDLFSHAIGDEVLKTVAALLRSESRDGDVVARYGGDEFVVVLRDTKVKAAARAGERIRAAVAEYPWWRLARGLNARVSVGVAEHRPGMTYEEVMSAADAALYVAKQHGRDQVAVA